MPKERPTKPHSARDRSKSPARQKRIASPASTGDRGGAFERRVQAVRLLALCLADRCPGVRHNFIVKKLQFQGRLFGHNTDDLVITTQCSLTGQVATLRMQMKRSLRATLNDLFRETVGLAWLDFAAPEFQREVDELLIVFDVSSASGMKGAIELVNFARSSNTFEVWDTKIQTPNFSNDAIRVAFSAIQAAVGGYSEAEVSPEELHQFVMHLRFLAQDLDSDRADGVESQKTLIRQSLPSQDADAVWAMLVGVCTELNGVAGEIDDTSLARHLGPLAEAFSLARLFRSGLLDLNMAKSNVRAAGSSSLDVLVDMIVPLLNGRSALISAASTDALPSSRENSANSFVSRRLDKVARWQQEHRYSDALEELQLLEPELAHADEHQQGRWYWMRATAHWHLGDDEAAAADFEKASRLCDSDDRIAAAGIRAHMLREESAQAVLLGQQLVERFPESFAVWMAAANARIQDGEGFTEADIPDRFREKAAAWQLVASALANSGDDQGAVHAIKTAMGKDDVSFFVREGYLRLVLRLVATSHVQICSRSLSPDRTQLLADAIATFDDREQTLWAIQSPKTLMEAVLHLAYGSVLLQKPDQALALIEESRRRGLAEAPHLIRFELEALCDLKRIEEAVDRFAQRIVDLPDEALLVFAQACFNLNRADLVNLIKLELDRRVPTEAVLYSRNALRYLHWEALIQAQKTQTLMQELDEREVTPSSDCIPDLVFAARAHMGNGADEALRLAFIERIAELARHTSDPQDLALSGQLMARCKRYLDAMNILQRLLPTTTFTPLHVDLLNCYAHTDHRARARDLLESMPASWLESGEAQDLALTLYREAGDWAKMRHVAESVLKAMPKNASAWLQLVQIAASQGSEHLELLLQRIPSDLEGEPKSALLVANAELRYGAVTSGLRRVYRVVRDNFDDVETAATHLSLMFVAEKAAKQVLLSPAKVEPGCSVELVDSRGNQRFLSLDLEDSRELRASSEFISPKSPQAQVLLGRLVGDLVGGKSSSGAGVQFEIRNIISIHKRLIDLSHQCVANAFFPSKTLRSFELPQREDGSYDFSPIQEMLENRSAHVTTTLGLYEKHVASLGLISQMLGNDVIDLIRDWPSDGPLLEVTTDLPENRPVFAAEGWQEHPLVVNLSMLVELASLELLDLLEHLPKVYVSTMTLQALVIKQEKLTAFPTSATMYAHEGQLGITELTLQKKGQDLAFVENMISAVSRFCEVIPAYGPLDPQANLPSLKQILSEEDYSALLICLEHKAGLLSLDGRLRKFAYLLEIASDTPQALFTQMLRQGVLPLKAYSRAVVKMMISRRSFVSLSAVDLITMMDQGSSFAAIGLNGLRAYLAASTVAIGSAVKVITDFIYGMCISLRCDVGVMLQLIEICLEPMLRHRDCTTELKDDFFDALKIRFLSTNVDRAGFRKMEGAISNALKNSLRPAKPVRLNALFFTATTPPYYASR